MTAQIPTIAEYLQRLDLQYKNAASGAVRVDVLIDLVSYKLRIGQRAESTLHVDEAFLIAQSVQPEKRARANARVMYGAALLSYFAGRYAEAVGQLHNAIESSDGSGDEINRIRSLTILAVAFGRLGGYSEGVVCAEAALAAATKRGDAFAMAHAHVAIGNLHLDRDGGRLAKLAFEAATPLAEASGDPLLVATVSVNRAATAHTIAQHAADELQSHRSASAANEKTLMLGEDLCHQIAQAHRLCEDALTVCNAVGHRAAAAIATANMAEVWFLDNNVDEATRVIHRAIILADALGNLDYQCNAYHLHGTFCLAAGRLIDANAALTTALGLAKQCGVLSLELKIQASRIACFERQGLLGEADAVRVTQLSLRESIDLAARADQDALADVVRESGAMPNAAG